MSTRPLQLPKRQSYWRAMLGDCKPEFNTFNIDDEGSRDDVISEIVNSGVRSPEEAAAVAYYCAIGLGEDTARSVADMTANSWIDLMQIAADEGSIPDGDVAVLAWQREWNERVEGLGWVRD